MNSTNSTFCVFVVECVLQFPEELDLLLQVFCLALTKDINLLETKKYDDSVDATDILVMEKEVSQRYLFMAEVLSSYPDLERECILTAFSMNPTAEFFDLVCTLAERQPQVKHDPDQDQTKDADVEQTTNTTYGTGPETEFIDALHVITGGPQILESKDYNAEVAPSRLIDELTMLSESVRHDLTCMLSVTRIKNLTWLTPWSKLKEECAQLLENEEKKRIVEKTTAAANAKLQYLKLNYDEFKDFKPHEYPGIEKGYEMYVPVTSSDESILRSDRDSDETDTAPESKMYKKREANRLSAKKRRQVRRRKKILEQLDDDREMNESRVRIIDGEKKIKAIQNMLNVKVPRPRRPRPKTTRPRKKKVKDEQIEPINAEDADAMTNVKSEDIDPGTTVGELPMQSLEPHIIETSSALVSIPNGEEIRQLLLVNQNVLQAVSDILGDTPNLMSTNGIELLEEIIGTKPEVNDIFEDIFDPETGALTIDAPNVEKEIVQENVVELKCGEQENENEQNEDATPVNEQRMRKRLSSEDLMICAKRRLQENGMVTQSDVAIVKSDFVLEQTYEQALQHRQQFPTDIDRTHNEFPAAQNCTNSPTEQTKDAFLMLESFHANEIKTEMIQNASSDRIENSEFQLNFESSAKIPTDIDGIILPQFPNHQILLPLVDTPYMSSHLMPLPLLPVATSPPTKEKPRNPLLAFRRQRKLTSSPAPGSFFSSLNSSMPSPSASTSFMHISAALRNLDGIDGEDHNIILKCNSPTEQMFVSSGTDTMPMSRRDSFSAMSFSSSGDHTSDSFLTAASNGPEILTKHCTIALQRIEDDAYLSHYLARDSHDTMGNHHNNDQLLADDNSNCRQNFLGNSLQPVVVLKQIDANKLVSNKCNLLHDKRTINGCNDETEVTAPVTCDETLNANSKDSDVLRQIEQNSYCTSTNLYLESAPTASSSASLSPTAPTNDNSPSNNNEYRKNNDEGNDGVLVPTNGNFVSITNEESIATPHEKVRDAINLMKKQNEDGEDNDDEDDEEDGRKSAEIDNQNGFHNHDDDDDNYNNGRQEQKKTTCGFTLEFSVSNGNRGGDGGNGHSDGNGQQQTQHQRCHQHTTLCKSDSQQLQHTVAGIMAGFSWNYVAAPKTKIRQLKKVSHHQVIAIT